MRWSVLVGVSAVALSLGQASSATPSGTDGGADPVVIAVGATEVRASELRFLLGRLHEFERRTYGEAPSDVRRRFVERKLVPELLAAEEAKRRRVEAQPAVAERIRLELLLALKTELEQQVDGKLTRPELEAYCRSEAGGGPDGGAQGSAGKACTGDLSGYRVVLRRRRAGEERERLVRELRQRQVRDVDYGLLERSEVIARTASAAAPAQQQQQDR